MVGKKRYKCVQTYPPKLGSKCCFIVIIKKSDDPNNTTHVWILDIINYENKERTRDQAKWEKKGGR